MAEQVNSKGKRPNQKRHQREYVVAPKLTAEEQEKIRAAQAKAEADKKAEALRLQNWEERVPKMSHKELVAEIRNLDRRERVKVGKDQYESIPGLSTAWFTVLGTVLEGTQTPENPFAKLSCYVR